MKRFFKSGQEWLVQCSRSSRAFSELRHRLYSRVNFENNIDWNSSKRSRLRSASEFPSFIFPAIVAGAFAGSGYLGMAHADTYEEHAQTWSTSESPSNYDAMEKIVRQEREKLEELLRKKGLQRGSYPSFTVAVKGQQVTIKFRVPPTCEVTHLIADLVSRLGQKTKDGGGSEMTMRAWDRDIEDTVLLALHRPDVYDNIARATRRKFESNRPRAVLFEGPPGTGKTSCARVIASQAGVPLLYVPLEVVLSKYYGESERLLGTVFSLANELPNGAIVFLDEVDSFAASRDNEMHEATRRILSVLLRQIDGFEQDKRVVVIAATNRKQDLDPALISRFDSVITFDLPDQKNREEITAQYARHLKKLELAEFGAVSEGMSGRDIRDVCQQAERHWASKIIRGQAPTGGEHDLPPIQEYIDSAEHRRKTLLDFQKQAKQNFESHFKKQPMAFAG